MGLRHIRGGFQASARSTSRQWKIWEPNLPLKYVVLPGNVHQNQIVCVPPQGNQSVVSRIFVGVLVFSQTLPTLVLKPFTFLGFEHLEQVPVSTVCPAAPLEVALGEVRAAAGTVESDIVHRRCCLFQQSKQ